jgi:hypothetical protein
LAGVGAGLGCAKNAFASLTALTCVGSGSSIPAALREKEAVPVMLVGCPFVHEHRFGVEEPFAGLTFPAAPGRNRKNSCAAGSLATIARISEPRTGFMTTMCSTGLRPDDVDQDRFAFGPHDV